MQILVSELSLSVLCDLRWEAVPSGLISIRCGPPEHEPARMYLFGQLVGLRHSGGLSHTYLTVKDRRYGARGRWTGGRLVYTFTPATIDPDTYALVYAPSANPVAAASIGCDDVWTGIKSGTADAKQLQLAARVLVTVALLRLDNFRPDAQCARPLNSQP